MYCRLLEDSPAKRCQIILLEMFVKLIFNWLTDSAILANLHCTSSKKYLYMTPNFFYFFAYEYQKYSELYPDFKSMEITVKNHPEKVICQKFVV
jgi:hypothetical protein